jgi:hypothetical protein
MLDVPCSKKLNIVEAIEIGELPTTQKCSWERQMLIQSYMLDLTFKLKVKVNVNSSA